MVKLRLSRIGKRKQPYYRIVAMNVSAPRNGRALAEVGTYDPLHASVKIDTERAIEWRNNGAQMTETVAALFDSQGVLAQWQGREAQVREDALSKDKPKRRRKLAAQAATPADEEAPEAEAAAEARFEEREALLAKAKKALGLGVDKDASEDAKDSFFRHSLEIASDLRAHTCRANSCCGGAHQLDFRKYRR